MSKSILEQIVNKNYKKYLYEIETGSTDDIAAGLPNVDGPSNLEKGLEYASPVFTALMAKDLHGRIKELKKTNPAVTPKLIRTLKNDGLRKALTATGSEIGTAATKFGTGAAGLGSEALTGARAILTSPVNRSTAWAATKGLGRGAWGAGKAAMGIGGAGVLGTVGSLYGAYATGDQVGQLIDKHLLADREEKYLANKAQGDMADRYATGNVSKSAKFHNWLAGVNSDTENNIVKRLKNPNVNWTADKLDSLATKLNPSDFHSRQEYNNTVNMIRQKQNSVPVLNKTPGSVGNSAVVPNLVAPVNTPKPPGMMSSITSGIDKFSNKWNSDPSFKNKVTMAAGGMAAAGSAYAAYKAYKARQDAKAERAKMKELTGD